MDCSHVWVHKEGKKKERCSKCNAARVFDPNQCSHLYVRKEGVNKERCSKCGAARVILEVQNIANDYDASEVK